MKNYNKIIALLLVIVCAFATQMVACSEVPASSTNSYMISIYTLQRSQDDDGNILTNGLQLKRQFMVVRSSAFRLDEATDKNSYEIASGTGKVLTYKNEVQVIPTSDMTLLIREGQLKTLNLYINGLAVNETKDVDLLQSYNALVVDTYEETFDLTDIICEYMNYDDKQYVGDYIIDCEFYAYKPVEIVEEQEGVEPQSEEQNPELNPPIEDPVEEKQYDLTGNKKPFKKASFKIRNGVLIKDGNYSCVIDAIRSFDVSIKVSEPKPMA